MDVSYTTNTPDGTEIQVVFDGIRFFSIKTRTNGPTPLLLRGRFTTLSKAQDKIKVYLATIDKELAKAAAIAERKKTQEKMKKRKNAKSKGNKASV